MSENFCNFLSQCLCRNISKRGSWQNLNNHPFIKEVGDSALYLKKNEKSALIDNDKLAIIIESIDNKFKLINEYYGNLEITQKTEYIKEIEIFLTLTLFEELMILKIFDRNENEPFTSQQEISFISIIKNRESIPKRININFSNPILSNMKIIEISNNELVSKFIVKLKKYISDLKRISLKIHEITKSDLVKGNYQSFLGKFIDVLESSNFHNYFFSLVKDARNCFEEKRYEEAYKKIPIASYICECILFVKASLFEKIDENKLEKVIGGKFSWNSNTGIMTYTHKDGSKTTHRILDLDKGYDLSSQLHGQGMPEDDILTRLINAGYIA